MCKETFVLDPYANEGLWFDKSNTEDQKCTCEPGYAVYPDVDPNKVTATEGPTTRHDARVQLA